MSATNLERFTEACNFPGILDTGKVEAHLKTYLGSLGMQRKIVRLQSGWELADHPPLLKNIHWILDDWVRRSPSVRAALAAPERQRCGAAAVEQRAQRHGLRAGLV